MVILARLLMTMTALVYGVAPPFADFAPSHVFNEDWSGHARFHTVWLLAITSGIAALVVVLLWTPGVAAKSRLRIASLLGLIVLGGFFAAWATMGSYGGAVFDPGHEFLIMGIDANVFVFGIALIVHSIGTAIVWRNSPDG